MRSCRVPIRPDRSRDAVEGAVGELADQQPRRINRARHGGTALGNAREAAFAVIGFVTNQHDEPVALDLPAGEMEGMRSLGLTNPGTPPNEESSIPDLLLYGLVPYGGSRPDYGIVIGVAAELEALVMFIEGPLGIALEMMARRLRVAVDLARRANTTPPPETA